MFVFIFSSVSSAEIVSISDYSSSSNSINANVILDNFILSSVTVYL